jgi:hypothetical protein
MFPGGEQWSVDRGNQQNVGVCYGVTCYGRVILSRNRGSHFVHDASRVGERGLQGDDMQDGRRDASCSHYP